MLNSSREHFGLHQGKNVKGPTKFEVPKYKFLDNFSYWHGPTAFPLGEAKEVVWEENQETMAEKCCYNSFLMTRIVSFGPWPQKRTPCELHDSNAFSEMGGGEGERDLKKKVPKLVDFGISSINI